MEKAEKIAVLAGNIRQFNAFDVKNKNRDKYIYVDRVEVAAGCRFTDVEIIGTFWEEVEEAGRLYDEVKSRII